MSARFDEGRREARGVSAGPLATSFGTSFQDLRCAGRAETVANLWRAL
jgi:hypothetical protein